MLKHKFAKGGVTVECKIEKNQIHCRSQETTAHPNNVFILNKVIYEEEFAELMLDRQLEVGSFYQFVPPQNRYQTVRSTAGAVQQRCGAEAGVRVQHRRSAALAPGSAAQRGDAGEAESSAACESSLCSRLFRHFKGTGPVAATQTRLCTHIQPSLFLKLLLIFNN